MSSLMSLYETYFPELRNWWMIQFCISVFGNTAFMAESNPLRLSVQAMKMSSTPLFFRLFNTEAQYLALSFSPTHMPSTSLCPSRSMAIAM